MASLTDCESNNDKNGKDDNIFNELSPLKSQIEKDVEEKQNETKNDISFLERLYLIKNNTTVEPIIACFLMTNIITLLAMQNLNLEKACLVNLNISNEICDVLRMGRTEKYTEYEAQAQIVVARILSWKNVIQTSLQLMVILFVGAWSDKTGRRKALFLLPLLGEFFTCIGNVINTYFFLELPAEIAVVTESIFPALTGGLPISSIGVFSYISDITTDENRTYRIGIVNCCMMVGISMGNALSGVLLSLMGYYGIYSLSASLHLCCFMYGFFFLEDSRRTTIKSKSAGSAAFLREFFDINLIMETFGVVFKKEAGRNRSLRISLVIIVACVVFGPIQGEISIMYLFIRYKFSWDEVQFSMWSTYCFITNLMGTLFSVNFFSGYLKLDDTLLGIISNTSKILAAFVYAFARNTLEILMAPLIEILNGTSYIAIRSIATKVVNSDEIGKMNSLLGLADAMMPLVYGSMYARVYEATIGVLPGAVFLVGAGLTLLSVAIFGWLYFERKKDLRLNNITNIAEK